MQIFGFLGSLLGYVLWGAFYLLKDFGLSIIVCTIIGAATVFATDTVIKIRKTEKRLKETRVKIDAIEIDPETGWVS